MIRIASVGDIMPGGILSGYNSGFVSQDVLALLINADIRVATLESAIGESFSFYEEKMKRKADVIHAKDIDLLKLKVLSVDIVSLANNHFFDLGPEGAEHCIKRLDDIGIKHIGAGKNLEEASAPVIMTINGHTVAFLAFCDWRDDTVGFCPFATEDSPGVNPMYDEYAISEIKKYSVLYDYVVVLTHWGVEHTWLTTQHVFKLSQMMRRAGATLILGSHPHRVQPVVNFRHCSVAFSMGNFCFPDRLITPPRSTFYSDVTIDYSNLPVTDGYPFVKEVTYKRWKPLARIGMIVFSDFIEKRVFSSFVLTRMSERGLISLFKDKNWTVMCQLGLRGIILRCDLYPLYYLLERYSRALYYRLVKFFGYT